MSDIERRYHRNMSRTRTIASKAMRRNARATAQGKMRKLVAVADILFREFNGLTIDAWECHHIEWIFDVWLSEFAEKTRMDYYRVIKTAMEYVVRHDQIPEYKNVTTH